MLSGLSCGGLFYEFNLAYDICSINNRSDYCVIAKTIVSNKLKESNCTLGFSCHSTFSIKLHRIYSTLRLAYKSTYNWNYSSSWNTGNRIINGSTIYYTYLKNLAALVLQGFLIKNKKRFKKGLHNRRALWYIISCRRERS